MEKFEYQIAVDGRFLLRAQRGMPIYVSMITALLPTVLQDTHFYILINSEFEHNDDVKNYSKRLADVASLKNVSVVDLKAEDEISWEIKLLPNWLKQHDIDLLHLPTNRVCLFTRTKQLVTLHDSMEWIFLKQLFPFPRNSNLKITFYILRVRFYVWLIYVVGLRKANRVLTISNCAQKSILTSFPHLKDKINYVYHGVPVGYINNPDIAALNARKGVLMLGGDSYPKNPENAIRAWARLPSEIREQHPLNIAGFTGNDSSPILKTIKELGIENDVRIHRWVEDSFLVKLFQESAALLFASREEGFGFPLIQAMACGTPVVISEAGVLVEIADGCALTAPAESPEKLAGCLQRVLTSAEIWREMHDKSLKRSGDFTWDTTANHIAETYVEILTMK
jgi:glycosyltransferase involved in cell wall biosynthesis